MELYKFSIGKIQFIKDDYEEKKLNKRSKLLNKELLKIKMNLLKNNGISGGNNQISNNKYSNNISSNINNK